MKRKRKKKVLAVVGWRDPRIIRGIVRYALEAGWHLESRSLFTDSIPVGWQGDGMLANWSDRADVRQFIRRQAKRQPTVLFGANNPGIQVPCVSADNYAAGRLAGEHLIHRGHNNLICCIFFGGEVGRARRDGFLEVVSAAGRRCALWELGGMQETPPNWNRRRNWLITRLRRLKKPCGLFAEDDQSASVLIEICLDLGFRVPDDVSIIGVGDLEPVCPTSPVPISSVGLRDEEAMWQAAALLDRMIDGEPAPESPILLPPQGLIVRQSSDFMAVTHPMLRKAVRFIEENCASPITIEDIVQAVGISRRTLYYLFSEQLAQSPANHLLAVRIERAKQMLLETNHKIGYIATCCGLGSPRNINRCFWRFEGLSPRAWQQAHRREP